MFNISAIEAKERAIVSLNNYSLGAGCMVNETNKFLDISMQEKAWIAFSFEIPKSGVYLLTLQINGTFYGDILIDGEVYNQTENLKLSNSYNVSLFLEKGSHSLILHNNKNESFIQLESISFIRKTSDKYIDTKKGIISVNSFSRYFEIGDMFSGSYINVNIARDMALVSNNGYQYISYYNSEGYLVVARRKLDQTYFEKYWVPEDSNFFLADPHNYISMQIDGKGYIHLAFGNHNSPLKYARSKYPYDISKWEILSEFSGDKEESYVTYVSFLKINNGDLLAFFRNGPHGIGNYTLYYYNTRGKSWQKLYSPFITDYGNSSPYLWRPIFSPQGTIHLAWTARLSNFKDLSDSPFKKAGFSGFTNKNIYYAKSDDRGISWENSSNSSYNVPLCISCVLPSEIIQEIPMGEDFFNHYGSDYDSKGNPHFVYTKRDNKSYVQQWHLYFNGERWVNNQVTDYKQKIEWTNPQQSGRASTDITRPSLLVSKDNHAIVISRSKEYNNIIEFYLSDKSYDNWTRIVVYNGSVGGWEPQADMDLWHSSEKINLLLIGITDEAIKNDWENTSIASNVKNNKFSSLLSFFKKIFLGLFRNIIEKKSDDYYSKITKVNILDIDSNLKKNTGYILEIDYNKLAENYPQIQN